jgi:hypothetical protein
LVIFLLGYWWILMAIGYYFIGLLVDINGYWLFFYWAIGGY